MLQSRRARGTSLATSLICLALSLSSASLAPSVLAQDPSPEGAAPTDGVDVQPLGEPSALCGVLTSDEVSAAFGLALQPGDSTDYDCSWTSDSSDLSLLVTRDAGDFELDAKETFPDGVALEVGGRPAWYTEEGLVLFVDVGDGMLFTIEVFGTSPEGLDLRSTLADLATKALPRLEAIPIPTEEPQPSSIGDPVLQALIPTRVGDAEMVVDVYTARDLVSDDPDDPDAATSMADLEALLGAHGKTLDDVSFANAYFATETAYGDLFAVRVAGVDVADFEDELADLVLQPEDPRRTSATIAGHPVTVLTDGPPVTGSPDPSADPFDLPLPPSYLYAKDDVLFIVSADEPELTQLFELLP